MSSDDVLFKELFVKYSPDVFRFAWYLCGDRDEAEDITSETFVRAWTSPGPIRQHTVKPYLFTIARNLYLRDRRRAAKHESLDHVVATAPQPSPHQAAEHSAQIDAVQKALANLSESDRTALLLYSVEEFTYAEIAELLGISLVAVKARIHRARLALSGVRTEWR